MLAAAVISTGLAIMMCIAISPRYQAGYHICRLQYHHAAFHSLISSGDLRPEIFVNPHEVMKVGMTHVCLIFGILLIFMIRWAWLCSCCCELAPLTQLISQLLTKTLAYPSLLSQRFPYSSLISVRTSTRFLSALLNVSRHFPFKKE